MLVHVFLLFLRFRKSLKKISSELDHNLQRFFIQRIEDGVQRVTEEVPQRLEAATMRGLGWARAQRPPLPLVPPLEEKMESATD